MLVYKDVYSLYFGETLKPNYAVFRSLFMFYLLDEGNVDLKLLSLIMCLQFLFLSCCVVYLLFGYVPAAFSFSYIAQISFRILKISLYRIL